uniref:Centrosomal protein of 85 kDa-like n=1 Tax=Scophthalmus maximus TaxID=52904 RepID=A0A8D3CZ75_SCOMX
MKYMTLDVTNSCSGSSSGGSPSWVPGHESAWHNQPPGPGNSICGGRRHSTLSDSCDTGIGTYYSDSVEGKKRPGSSPTPLSFHPLSQRVFTHDDDGIPIVHVLPSPSSSSSTAVKNLPVSHLGAPSYLDMKDHQPIRRWSSLTKLSSGTDKGSNSTSGYKYNPDSQGSLDRGLSLSSTLSSPVKHNSLDMSYGALPEAKLGPGGGQVYGLSLPKHGDSPLGHQPDRASPIQPAVRTQMWLTEQMEYRPKAEHQTCGPGIEGCGGDGSLSWQQGHQQEPGLNQVRMLTAMSLPINTLVKVKEGLLGQRELEINRQKQQILQLHARIRENELRAQQVLQRCRASSLLSGCAVMRNLVGSWQWPELEVLHLNQLLKQVTQKHSEDVRKLEEKIKTRDRYITSLKKKCQRESEQSHGKQQRIETLEKYLSDLPTLDEVQAQAQQVHTHKYTHTHTHTLQRRGISGVCLERDVKIQMQAKREKELIASVHRLQQKVQQCLDDGVRLPVQDLKQLEVENTQLLEQQDHSSKVASHTNGHELYYTVLYCMYSSQVRKPLTLLLCKMTVNEGPLVQPLSHVEMPGVDQLLREMSRCLLDLQALCSILAQRAQGKEPNLSLLLGMKCMWGARTHTHTHTHTLYML